MSSRKDRPGHLPGGLISEVQNARSHRTYVISTSLELGQDYWSTAVLPVAEERRLFGLSRRAVVDFENPVLSVIRNTLKDAHEVHEVVCAVVAEEPEEHWLGLVPSDEPPDGWSPGARARFRQLSSNPGPQEPTYSEDPHLEAAYRILLRGSVDPGAYLHDARRVLAFACSQVANLVALQGDIKSVAEVVEETPETIEGILTSAGYDVACLVTGEKKQRFLNAMESTNRLFDDIVQKYGSESTPQ